MTALSVYPMSFVHLSLHSEYSLIDGLIKINPLISQLKSQAMPACAITDHCNLFALVKFYQAALAAGIKPIVGAELWLNDGETPKRLILLCQNHAGYHNLTELISKAYLHGQVKGRPLIKPAWLTQHNAGLIMLSGHQGDVGRYLLDEKPDLAKKRLAHWLKHFPNRCYLSVQRTGRKDEERHLHRAVDLASDTGVPVVACNDVCFLAEDDFEAHEARVCIHEGSILDDNHRARHYSPQQYLRTDVEMRELFSDIPEAIENTEYIAQRCNLHLSLGKNFLPEFPLPAGKTTAQWFSEQAQQGLEQRLVFLFADKAQAHRLEYQARLDAELQVISQMDFAGYFLIVADFIRWAKDHGIPVGPGRGSGAGSLVAYALGITDLDPIQYDLLFERFLNPERVSMPDFDVDFCVEGRDRVIDYVAQHYGREKVSQIITYGTMAAKAVVRDVGRVMGHPYGFVDKIAKLIPFDPGMTLDDALAQEQALRQRYEQEEDVHQLIDMARKLEGLTRNAGKHAGGVVIAPSKLTDFTPLYCEQDGGSVVSQFDKNDVEAVGLIKFDFLGLRTLTIIDWTLKNIQKLQQDINRLDILAIPLDDKPTFALLQAAKTTAIFQLESRGMKELIKKLQPSCFEDIIALVALFRPGPLQSGMVDDFINRKHGRAKIEYPHPDLEPILKPTYGVILYQEQVMQIAQVLAGYTLGGADILRRAMGKKKAAEMAEQRAIFTAGALEKNIDEQDARYIFDLMENFAAYGFNKSIAKKTKIYTISGIKSIEDCKTGDTLLTLTPQGHRVYSQVVALHDHGRVPLWEIEFNDGTIERCTLDHKWLTENGQQPLWKIIQMGGSVWGCVAHTTGNESPSERMPCLQKQEKEIPLGNPMWRSTAQQTCCSCSSENLSNLSEYDPHRPYLRQRARNVLWRSGAYPQKNQRAFQNLCCVPTSAARHSGRNLQKSRTHAKNACQIFRNGTKNGHTSRNTTTTCQMFKTLARCPPRRISSHSRQSPCFAQTLKNGNVVRASFNTTWICAQYPFTLSTRTQASGFCQPPTKNSHRSRWALAFFTHQFRRTITASTNARSHVGSGNSASILAINPSFDAMFQRQLWRTYLSRTESTHTRHQRYLLGGDTVLWRPVRATFMGWHQGYDLEVDHPEHHFLLASGLCCSNSHSAAYALISYQTAWLKAHYPAPFMAAMLSAEMDKTDKVVPYLEECREMQLTVCPPHVNGSFYQFTVNEDKQIHYGLGAIKGAGEAALLGVIEEREQRGLFQDLFDFCQRIDLRKCNKRVLEALIKAGALDLGENPPDRALLLASLPTAVALAEQYQRNQHQGQTDLFALWQPSNATRQPALYTPHCAWSDEQRLQAEKEVLGLYLSGHPIDSYLTELNQFTSNFEELRPDKKGVKVAGLLVAQRNISTAGGKIAIITLEQGYQRLDVVLYNKLYETLTPDLLHKDAVLVAEGDVRNDRYNDGLTLQANRLLSLGQARAVYARCLRLTLIAHQLKADFCQQLHTSLMPYRNDHGCMIQIQYQHPTGIQAYLSLPAAWRVLPENRLLFDLQNYLGKEGVELIYSPSGGVQT